MKRVLGIDCSSTTIGWSIIDIDDNNEIHFFKCAYHKPLKTGSIIDRIAYTRDAFKKIMEEYKPDHISIEEIIQFMKGKSTAKTIIMLTTFNRMLCLLAHDFLGHNPNLFSVMTIRHGLKTDKILPKKEEMPALVALHLGITFPYEMNKKGAIKVESYDMADGVAVGLYQAMLLTEKIKKKKAATTVKKKK